MTKCRLPENSFDRKNIPLATGVLDYFPDALAYVAYVSKIAGDKHHPGEPMHWERDKSNDHADALLRHLTDRGAADSNGVLHSGMVAWRALALLQEELEGYTLENNPALSREDVASRASHFAARP